MMALYAEVLQQDTFQQRHRTRIVPLRVRKQQYLCVHHSKNQVLNEYNRSLYQEIMHCITLRFNLVHPQGELA